MEYVRVPKADWLSILDTTREKSGYAEAMVSGEVATKIDGIPNGGGGTGGNIPDGTNVTFGNVDGTPVEREAVYAISSEDLNALGAIVQRSLGTEALMTFAEIINALKLMEFAPVGYANCVLDGSQLTMFETNAIGSLEV